MAKRSEPKASTDRRDDQAEAIEEQNLDEALDQTFPASDPPPWTMGVEENKRESPDDDRKHTDK